jgi:hypothetical protein
MAIEIVYLPIENGGSFHRYVNVYQRVSSNLLGMYIFRTVADDTLFVNPGFLCKSA